MLREGLKPFWLALMFLTRLPAPRLDDIRDRDMGRSLLAYPLVGLIIGGLLCLPLVVLPQADPLLLAAFITVLWAIITGALHLDGLGDAADGWLGGHGDAERTLAIMQDPRSGAAAVVAIAALLLLKLAALKVIVAHGAWPTLLLAPFAGRLAPMLLFLTTAYVRKGGISTAIVAHLPRGSAWVVLVLGALALGVYSLPALIGVLAVFWLLRRLMLRRIGGCTGDTAGALLEITETSWLVAIGLML